MRLGRTRFWSFAALNIAAAAALVALLPAGMTFPRLGVSNFPIEELPFKPMVAYFACLPLVWLGAQRLHDVGQRGWHAWMPLIAFAGWTIGANLMGPLMLALAIVAQNTIIVQLVPALFFGAWILGLLVAAGAIRTVFLWLQPGDTADNRHGPALSQPVQLAPARPGPLSGRMGRLVFWLLLGANVAAAKGLGALALHWPGMMVTEHDLQTMGIVLYLPSFAITVLRLHDRGQRGWIVGPILLVNLAAIWAERAMHEPGISLLNFAVNLTVMYLLFQCLQPGEAGANRYGSPPGGGGLGNGPQMPDAQPQPSPGPVAVAPRVTTGAYRAPVKPTFGRRTS